MTKNLFVVNGKMTRAHRVHLNGFLQIAIVSFISDPNKDLKFCAQYYIKQSYYLYLLARALYLIFIHLILLQSRGQSIDSFAQVHIKQLVLYNSCFSLSRNFLYSLSALKECEQQFASTGKTYTSSGKANKNVLERPRVERCNRETSLKTSNF